MKINIFLLFFISIKLSNVLSGLPDVELISDNSFTAFITYNQTRLRLSSSLADHNAASLSCIRDQSKLIEITDNRTQLIVEKLLNSSNNSKSVWIGLKLRNKSLTQGLWNGETEWSNKSNYSNFMSDQPDDLEQSCIQLWYEFQYTWDNTICSLSKKFICQDKIPNAKDVSILLDSVLEELSKTTSTTGELLNHVAVKVEEIFKASTADLLENDPQKMNKLLSKVEKSLENYNFQKNNETINHSNIQMQALKVSDQKVLKLWETAKLTKSSQAILEVDLLQELTNQKSKDDKLKVMSLLYRDTSIFEAAQAPEKNNWLFGKRNVHKPVILSNVLSVSVKINDLMDLKTPLKIVNVIPNQNLSGLVKNRDEKVVKFLEQSSEVYIEGDMRLRKTQKCVYWDFHSSSWTTDKCKTAFNEDKSEVICSCKHMTHFAVILDITETYFPKYQTIFTYIGCSISMICLLMTISINIYFKQLRSKLSQKILINLSSALLLFNFVFLIGIDAKDNPVRCLLSAASLHYLLLLSWSWHFVEGVFLFKYLIWSRLHNVVINEDNFFRISATCCYLVPAAVVVPTAVVLGLNDQYISDRSCWLSSVPMLFSVVIPIGVVLIFNIFVFVFSIYNITCGKKFKNKSASDEIRLALKRGSSMVFALGIPWIFGYLMLLSENKTSKEIFSIIFSIVNSLQGATIFIFYCLLNKNVVSLFTNKLDSLTPQQTNNLRQRLVHSLRHRHKQKNMLTPSKAETNFTTSNLETTNSTLYKSTNTLPKVS